MTKTKDLEKALAFVAYEFLEEELRVIENVYKLPEFVQNGKYVENLDSKYIYEFWARPEDIEKLNKCIEEHK